MPTEPSIDGGLELRKAIEFAKAVHTILGHTERKDPADKLAATVAAAEQMRFAVGIVGQAKRGKSTLVNALLGRHDDMMAPVDRFPATNVVSCFADGPREDVKVLFTDSHGKPAKDISVSEIKHYACEEFNPGNQKGVQVIEVMAPFPRLGRNVLLVDTPGADNAASNLHDIVLLEYLPRLDAVIFLVTADEPLNASELELLRQVRKSDVRKLPFAVNKADKVEPDEMAQGIDHNARALRSVGFEDAQFFVISAKNYYKGEADDGVERLLHSLADLIGQGRAKAIAERLTAMATRMLEEARMELSAELALSEKSAEEIRLEQADLVKLRENLERTRPGLERRFQAAWQNALADFEDALPAVERRMVSEYQDLVERTPGLALEGLGKTIHTDVLKRLDELIDPHASKLKSSLDDAVHLLQIEYGSVCGMTPRQLDAIATNKDLLIGAADIAASATPSAVGAFLVSSLPGLVGSVIAGTAPAVAAAVWYNPLTWIAAAGTGTAAAATGVAAGAVTAVLAPLAAIGTPLLFIYSGYRAFTTWRFKVVQGKNALSSNVKDLIISAIAETSQNVRRWRLKSENILAEFNAAIFTKLDESNQRMDLLLEKRPVPQRIVDLKAAIRRIENLMPRALPSSEPGPSDNKRLFPQS